MSLPRPLVRVAVLGTVTLAALASSIGVASAHVTVASQDAAPGGFGKLTFRVPDESATASTVRLRIQLPTATPLASLSVQPVPGWTVTTTKVQLNPPVTDDDGNKVTEAVSVVQFTADAGGGVKPGEFQEFSLSGGKFPDTGSLTLPVIQTYSDGSETAWIEPTVEGQAEPRHPAPVLTLPAATGTAAGAAADSTASPTTAEHSHGATATTSGPVGLALFLAILALVAAIAAAVLGWRANRRTVSS